MQILRVTQINNGDYYEQNKAGAFTGLSIIRIVPNVAHF